MVFGYFRLLLFHNSAPGGARTHVGSLKSAATVLESVALAAERRAHRALGGIRTRDKKDLESSVLGL